MNYLSEVAVGRKNNITFIRLVAALMVIYGHSYAIVQQGGQDLVTRLTGYAHAGGVAVDMFFLMSGFLVTASIVNGGIKRYFVSRVLRIYPALWVNLLVVTLIVGPIITTLALGSYFSDAQTWKYLGKLGSGLQTEWFLPGVFQGNRDHAVNGSIWSIIVEIRMYLILAAVFALRLYRFPAVFNTFFFVLLVLTYSELVGLPWFPAKSTDLQVATYFLIGSFLYVNRERIPVSPYYLLIALMLAAITVGTPKFPVAYALVLTTLFVWIAFGSQFHWIDKHDYSYGIYLYGWPVQQLVALGFPSEGALFNAALSMAIATALGAMSWHFIEAPALKLKSYFGKRADARTGVPPKVSVQAEVA